MASAAYLSGAFVGALVAGMATHPSWAEPAAPKGARLHPVSTPSVVIPETQNNALPFCPSLNALLGDDNAQHIQRSMQNILAALDARQLLDAGNIDDILGDYANFEADAKTSAAVKLDSFFSAWNPNPFVPTSVILSSKDGYLWLGRVINLVYGLQETDLLTVEDLGTLQADTDTLTRYYDYMNAMTVQPECKSIPMAQASPA